MLKYLLPKRHQKQLDNDLKIALLNYFSKADVPFHYINPCKINNQKPFFIKLFKYIKSISN
jgi:hypothetical protein